ncbi:unnamed protein product [Cladocopium goreaui]|uniref:Uncharacterized protein n=1 Tax=Cladocopium goreaui TaxID=2562237 RepID=A0A9P1CRX9_9DINO|nr:unnamed protein product [Cladocopium goreaui]
MASGVNPLLALGLSTCVDIYADICDVLNGPAEQEQQCKENMKTELAALLGTPEDNHCSPTSLGCQHESIMDVVKVEEVSLQGPNFATWIKPIDVRRTDLTVQYGAPLRSFAKNASDGMFIAFHALDLARGCSALFSRERLSEGFF